MSNCIEHEVGEFNINQWVGLRDDECTVDTYERESAAPGEYILGNFRPCGDCGATKAREIAEQHPQMQVSDGVGWISSGGCKVDDDSNIILSDNSFISKMNKIDNHYRAIIINPEVGEMILFNSDYEILSN